MKKVLVVFLFSLLPAFTFAFDFHSTSSFTFHPYKDNIFSFSDGQIIYSTTDGTFWTADDITVLDQQFSNASGHVNINRPQFEFLIAEQDSTKYTMFRSRDAGETWVRSYQSGLPLLDKTKENFFAFTTMATAEEKVLFWHTLFDQTTLTSNTSMYSSNDYGTTFSPFDTKLDTTGAESVFLVPFIGKPGKGRTQSLYACVVKAKTSQSWQYTWYRADSYTSKLDEKINYEFPESYKLLWFDVSPQDETIMWALAVDSNGKLAAFYTGERARTWTKATLPSEVTIHDSFSVHKGTSALLITTKDNIYSIEKNSLDSPQKLVLPFLKEGVSLDDSEIGTDSFFPKEMIIKTTNPYHVMRTKDAGKNWTDIAPQYAAKWISQTAVNPAWNAYTSHPGETFDVTFSFKNAGNVAWEQLGEQRVGLYVYKDPVFSWPYAYNDPSTGLAGQSFFADLFSWGPSANRLVPNARAALIKEMSVTTEKEATFNVTFKVPDTAEPNPFSDDPNTPYDDRFYREDLSIAYGTTWMKNTSNGDPFGNAHIWVPIKVLAE